METERPDPVEMRHCTDAETELLHASTCRDILATVAKQVAGHEDEPGCGLAYILPHPHAKALILVLGGHATSEAASAALSVFEIANKPGAEKVEDIDAVKTRFALLDYEPEAVAPLN